MTIVAADSVSGFFQEVVEDAMKSRRVEVTGGATSYLVALLADYAHPDARTGATLNRPLAFLLDEALRTPEPAERFERLRSLGDGVLYACGFFGDHFEARGVEQRYLFGIGSCAYDAAGSMLRKAPAAPAEEPNAETDLFGELAGKFGVFVDVLVDVADSTIAMGTAASGAKGLLKVYERWLKTGSDRLAGALATQGLMPTRGVKGLQ
jgi:hypothetical protein